MFPTLGRIFAEHQSLEAQLACGPEVEHRTAKGRPSYQQSLKWVLDLFCSTEK